jgi:hypothetical protein
MAWLYGIPYERMWPPAQASRNRRLALAAVALGRVLLMTRCVNVLCGCNGFQALLIVTCFAVPTAALAVGCALALVRRPEVPSPFQRMMANQASAGAAAVRVVVDEMSSHAFALDAQGELRADVLVQRRGQDVPRPPRGTPKLEPRAEEMLGVVLGGCGTLLLLLFSCGLFTALTPPSGAWHPLPLVSDAPPPSEELWCFVAAALLFWTIALIVRQPAQRRRTLFAERLRTAPLRDTLHDLGEHDEGDFPPGWDPSAALASKDDSRRLLDAIGFAAALPADSWVRTRFLERLRRTLPLWTEWFDLFVADKEGKPTVPLLEPARLHELTQLRDLLCSLPERAEMVEPYRDYLAALVESAEKRDPARAELLQEIYLMAAKRGCRR